MSINSKSGPLSLTLGESFLHFPDLHVVPAEGEILQSGFLIRLFCCIEFFLTFDPGAKELESEDFLVHFTLVLLLELWNENRIE